MKLDYIDLTNLKPSPLNVRKHGGDYVTDLLPSIRSLGLLQPLLVRPEGDGFEIVAGQRRFTACQALVAEGCDLGPLPCLIMAEGDDAAAIEASLAENIARLPMDEIDQYEAFAAMLKQGRACEDIAAHFGVTERLVKQRLAVANLYPPILNAYRRDEIAPATLRILTMATMRQQKAWWKLHKAEDGWAPTGVQLKSWLFGGAHVPTSNARFDLADYPGTIVTDLFDDASYFAECDTFWELQNQAISALVERYRTEGWTNVVLHEVGAYWCSWEYQSVGKDDGGAIHITCTADGEVQIHEGFLTRKEAQRHERQPEGSKSTPQAELTRPLQNYLDLHRHAAVRTTMLQHPSAALRLMVAHAIAGSSLWQVKPDPQRAENKAIADSLAECSAETTFQAEREAIAELLGRDPAETIVRETTYGVGAGEDLLTIFKHLLELNDETVMRILTFVMAETMVVSGALIDELGQFFAVDMRSHWAPDEAFFTLLRNKSALNAMVAELAGTEVAKSHLTSTAKVQKSILRDCLNGTRPAKVENWQPQYMQFPMAMYGQAAEKISSPAAKAA
ncbi:ParB/RepB/Spo0J family partition protein [Roseibium sp. AS2]|uniref:ParB/RepB/Spo0J family partition protein n=1 Tax=Roseibium sp. AS2 TaxID=3135781 RepID=UPI00317C474A